MTLVRYRSSLLSKECLDPLLSRFVQQKFLKSMMLGQDASEKLNNSRFSHRVYLVYRGKSGLLDGLAAPFKLGE